MTNPILWSDSEIAKLRKLAGTMSASDIGKELKRTKDAVKSQIHRWKLPTYVPNYGKPTETVEAAPTPVPEPPKAVPVALRQSPKPALRQKVIRVDGVVEYCTECGSPVSNWVEHHQRLGHRRPA